MGEKQQNKRRIYVIDRDFQFKYLMTWMLLTLCLLGGMTAAALSIVLLVEGPMFLEYFLEINAAAAVMITGVSLWYMVHHSHRIAGPAYRLRKVLEELADGQYDLGRKVVLRKKDYLKQVAEALNRLIERRAAESAQMNILAGGMAELNDAIQTSGSFDPGVKELSKKLFVEIAELSGAPARPGTRNPLVEVNAG